MADQSFRLNGLLTMAVDGVFNVQRMGSALSQVANAGDNVAKAFQAQAYAAGFANIATVKFASSMSNLVGAAADFEAAMSKGAALVGKTSIAIDSIRTMAMTTRDLTYGPAELVNVMLELNRAGISGAQAFNDLKVTLDLATVAEMNTADASVALSNAFKGWAGPLDMSAQIMDKFAAAANQSTFNMKSLIKAMEMAQRQAIPMGVSLESTLTGLMLLAPITGPNSKAGTTFGSFAERMGDPRVLKNLTKQFPNLKLSPYTAGGTEIKDPLDFAVEVYEKRRTLNAQQRNELDKVLVGKMGKGMIAAISRLFDMGIDVVDPATGGKMTMYGKAGLLEARKALVSKQASLAEQAAIIRDNPRAVMKITKDYAEAAMISLGKRVFEVFSEYLLPTLNNMIKAFQYLSNVFGGILPKIAVGVATFAALRVAFMGISSMVSILPAFLLGRQIGPLNAALGGGGGGAAAGAAGAGVTSMAALRAQQVGGGPYYQRLANAWVYRSALARVPPRAQVRYPAGMKDAEGNNIGGRFGPNLLKSASAGDELALAQLNDRISANTADIMNNTKRGKIAGFINKYVVGDGDAWYSGGVNAYKGATSAVAGSKWYSKLSNFASNTVAGTATVGATAAVLKVSAGAVAALGSFASAAALAVAPVALMAYGISKFTDWLADKQAAAEEKDRKAATFNTMAEAAPTAFGLAIKNARLGGIEAGDMQQLVQDRRMMSIFARLVEAGQAAKGQGMSAGSGILSGYLDYVSKLDASATSEKGINEFGSLEATRKGREALARSVARIAIGVSQGKIELPSGVDLSGSLAPLTGPLGSIRAKLGAHQFVGLDEKSYQPWMPQFLNVAPSGYGLDSAKYTGKNAAFSMYKLFLDSVTKLPPDETLAMMREAGLADKEPNKVTATAPATVEQLNSRMVFEFGPLLLEATANLNSASEEIRTAARYQLSKR